MSNLAMHADRINRRMHVLYTDTIDRVAHSIQTRG